MARALKDVFCRYKTLKGFRVNRKAGWDTHGLPVELSVEKKLGITDAIHMIAVTKKRTLIKILLKVNFLNI